MDREKSIRKMQRKQQEDSRTKTKFHGKTAGTACTGKKEKKYAGVSGNQ